MSRTNVGFIGLGNIGQPGASPSMACCRSLTTQRRGGCMIAPCFVRAIALGARASTPAEIARNCPLIGICVRDDKDVDSLFYGDAGMLAHAAKDTVIAIHSTVTQAGLARWAQAVDRSRGWHVES